MTRLIDADALKRELEVTQYNDIDDLTRTEKLIDNAPTVIPDVEFAEWVTKMIFDNNEIEDFDFELFSELACRKLEKMGLVKKTKSEWVKMKEGDEE